MSPRRPTPRELYEGVCVHVFGWMVDAKPPLQEVGELFEDFERYMAELAQTRKKTKENDVADPETFTRTFMPNGGGPFAV